jgi:ribosome-binding factor A
MVHPSEVMRRPERLAEVLREEIIEIVGYELEDPRVLGVTVTDVRVTENLRDAKVYVLVEGTEPEIREAMKALDHAAAYVKQQVALNLNLHHAPHLHFARDTVEENATRIAELLDEVGPISKSRNEGETEG